MTPVKVSPTVAQATPKAHEPRDPRPDPIRLSAASRQETRHRAGREDDRRGERGAPSDGSGADQLGAAGLLLGPGVPADEDDGQSATQTAPSSRVLKIANESGLSGSAMGPYMPMIAGLPSSAPGGVDGVLALVEVDGALGRAAGEGDEAEDAEGDDDPVAAQGELQEGARAGIPAHAPHRFRGWACSRYSLRNSCSSVGGWQVRLWMPCWPRRARTSPTRAVSTVNATRDPSVGEVLDAGDALEQRDRRRVGEDGVDAGAAEVAHVGERAGLDGAAGADDADAVGERLDLAEDVAGEQHGAALAAQVLDDAAEDRLHQRVQPGGRLVEQEQLDVGGQGGDEGDLLPVALGVGAALLGRVELEPLDEVVPAGHVGLRRGAGREDR